MDFDQLIETLELQGNAPVTKPRKWPDSIAFEGSDEGQGFNPVALGHKIMDSRKSIEMRNIDPEIGAHNPEQFDIEISTVAPKLEVNIDFAAVYWPITYYGNNWGIGIRSSAIESLARNILLEAGMTRLKGALGFAAKQEAELLAIWIYFFHEQYHHKVEMFALRQQLLSGTKYYEKYNVDVYEKLYLTNSCLEEALANVNKRDEFKKKFASKSYAAIPWTIDQRIVEASQRVIKSLIKNAHPGY